MTTLTQKQPIIQFWELYERDEIIRGQSVPHVPVHKAKRYFDIVYEFRGVNNHYIVATHNASITRQAALEWCQLHAKGRCVRRSVDLSPCNPPR